MSAGRPLTVMLVAAEASGDNLGAGLAKALRQRNMTMGVFVASMPKWAESRPLLGGERDTGQDAGADEGKRAESQLGHEQTSRRGRNVRLHIVDERSGACMGPLVSVWVVMFMLKNSYDEQQRIQILLNKTREEIARDHITRAEVRADLEKIMERFDTGFTRLEAKIDALAKGAPK